MKHLTFTLYLSLLISCGGSNNAPPPPKQNSHNDNPVVLAPHESTNTGDEGNQTIAKPTEDLTGTASESDEVCATPMRGSLKISTVVVRRTDELNRISKCVEINYSLDLSQLRQTNIDLGVLTKINGSLIVESSESLRSLTATSLFSIRDSLIISKSGILEAIHFPALERIGANLQVGGRSNLQSNFSLQSLKLPKLSTVQGDMIITLWNLNEFDISQLTRVEGEFILVQPIILKQFVFDKLTHVGKALHISTYNNSGERYHFPSLETLHGNLNIYIEAFEGTLLGSKIQAPQLYFDQLKVLQGRLSILSGNADKEQAVPIHLQLPHLESIGNDLEIIKIVGSAEVPSTINLPQLYIINGDYIVRQAELASAPKLDRINGQIRLGASPNTEARCVTNSAILNEASIHVKHAKAINVCGLTALSQLTLPTLETLAQNMIISTTTVLERIDAPQLESIGTQLAFFDNQALQGIYFDATRLTLGKSAINNQQTLVLQQSDQIECNVLQKLIDSTEPDKIDLDRQCQD